LKQLSPLVASIASNSFDVAIVGAGWAGLSAAITCVEAGKRVVLFDAAPQAGGRARHQAVQLTENLKADLDNGQHLLIGAYTSCLSMMTKVGAAPLARNRLSLHTESGIHLESRPTNSAIDSMLDALIPALAKRGLSFLKAKGLSSTEKFSIVGALVKLSVGRSAACWDGYCKKDETVAALLDRLKQPYPLQQQFWNPLCIATMNTLPIHADAATFSRVLRDTFGNPVFEASDFLLPQTHLGASFPEPALHWLKEQGCVVHLRTAVTSLRRDEDQAIVLNGEVAAHQLILAMPPDNAHRLLTTLLENNHSSAYDPTESIKYLAPLASFHYLPIATVYLAWRKKGAKTHAAESIPAIFMLDDLRAEGRPGQWLFNRASIIDQHDQSDSSTQGQVCLASVVVSAWDSSVSLDELSKQVQRQVASIKHLPLPVADFAKAIIDKKATLACTPDRPRFAANYLQRFTSERLFHSIWLAGDYCYPLYPATLEGAVRSGIISANLAVAG
jgi:hydroxysqualene dehydroxylase